MICATSGRLGREMMAAVFWDEGCGLDMLIMKGRLYRISTFYHTGQRDHWGLERAVKEEFAIAFGPKDRRLDRIGLHSAKIFQR